MASKRGDAHEWIHKEWTDDSQSAGVQSPDSIERILRSKATVTLEDEIEAEGQPRRHGMGAASRSQGTDWCFVRSFVRTDHGQQAGQALC